MASVKNLKKDINYTLGDIIDICGVYTQLNADADRAKADEIVDEVIVVFDELIAKVNAKNVDNKKAHFTAISKELEEKANGLITKINAL
ncbi:hypothetical protein [Tenacibaculum geojense]|uniref:Uncharacterized protein n=1 Tax=Tenacibaculum geojense TaxID=915352 RepID=A0ABW3JME4_9FLAO